MSSHFCLLCPSGQRRGPQPQQTVVTQQSQRPSLICPLCAWSHGPGVSGFIAPISAALWTERPTTPAHHPQQSSRDPARRSVGPSMQRALSRVLPPCACPVRPWPRMLRNHSLTMTGAAAEKGSRKEGKKW